MTDKDELNSELERFISDWYWDEESHEYAQKLGEFLFDFIDSLRAKNMKEKTYYDFV